MIMASLMGLALLLAGTAASPPFNSTWLRSTTTEVNLTTTDGGQTLLWDTPKHFTAAFSYLNAAYPLSHGGSHPVLLAGCACCACTGDGGYWARPVACPAATTCNALCAQWPVHRQLAVAADRWRAVGCVAVCTGLPWLLPTRCRTCE